MDLEEYIRKIPKIELHVHLEGAILPSTLLKLAARHNVDLPCKTEDELREWLTMRDFDHFIEIFQKISECIQTADDIELLTKEFLEGQYKQNILYTEFTYTAWFHYEGRGISFEDQLGALERGRQWAHNQYGVRSAVVIDIPRHNPVCLKEDTMTTIADWIISAKNRGVVAIGLGGAEVGFPPEKFEMPFKKVLDAGMKSVPHAGETEGAVSIWGAIDTLKAHRIGHGVRCLEDPKLIDELRQRKIALEVCPSSNVRLGVVPNLESHPLSKLIELGLVVTLNSDDPPMFHTTLTQEYYLAVTKLGLSLNQLHHLIFTAVDVSFLPDMEKQTLRKEIEDYIQQHHQQQ